MIVVAGPEGQWLASPRAAEPPAARLFGFPHAGGSYLAFSAWREHLPAEVEVLSFCYPGRLRRIREEPIAHMRPLVAELYAMVAGMLDVPFVFAGHSLGALVAFELARHLRAANGPEPSALVVAGRSAPQLPRTARELHGLAADDLVRALRDLEGLPPGLEQSDELLSIVLPSIRADLRIDERYAYEDQPPLDAAILALAGRSDPQVTPAEVEAWRRQTRSEFQLETFAAGHFFVASRRDEVLPLVARKVNEWLGRADRAPARVRAIRD